MRFASSVRVTVSDLRTGCTLDEGVLIILCTVRSALEIKGIIKMQFATQKSKHVYKINTVLFFNPTIVYHSGCLYSTPVFFTNGSFGALLWGVGGWWGGRRKKG